jgi:hypothetical protein
MAEESPLRRRVTWEFLSSRCQQVCSLATFSVKRTGTSIRGGGSYRKHMAQRSFRRVLWSQLRLTSLSPSPSTQSRLRVFCGRVQSLRWVQGELSNFGPSISAPDKDDAVPRVRKADEGNARAARSVLRTGCHEGPTIHFDMQEPPPLISPVGPAVLWRV